MKFEEIAKTVLVLFLTAAIAYGGLACYETCETSAADSAQLPENSMTAAPVAASDDVVTEWNRYAATLTLAPSPVQQPIQQTRSMAIVHLAVHDAVNGITRKYDTYEQLEAAPVDASVEAAAAAAAYKAML